MDEIGQKLATIPQLRVYPYNVDKIPPPGAIVGLPESVDFDATYGRGSDSLILPVWVMVARANAQAAGAQLAAYLDGSGDRSVKAAVDSTNSNTYSSCDEVTVTKAVPGAYTSGGVDMLGAEFTVTVAGQGGI
jgi:hypothetical protein